MFFRSSRFSTASSGPTTGDGASKAGNAYARGSTPSRGASSRRSLQGSQRTSTGGSRGAHDGFTVSSSRSRGGTIPPGSGRGGGGSGGGGGGGGGTGTHRRQSRPSTSATGDKLGRVRGRRSTPSTGAGTALGDTRTVARVMQDEEPVTPQRSRMSISSRRRPSTGTSSQRGGVASPAASTHTNTRRHRTVGAAGVDTVGRASDRRSRRGQSRGDVDNGGAAQPRQGTFRGGGGGTNTGDASGGASHGELLYDRRLQTEIAGTGRQVEQRRVGSARRRAGASHRGNSELARQSYPQDHPATGGRGHNESEMTTSLRASPRRLRRQPPSANRLRTAGAGSVTPRSRGGGRGGGDRDGDGGGATPSAPASTTAPGGRSSTVSRRQPNQSLRRGYSRGGIVVGTDTNKVLQAQRADTALVGPNNSRARPATSAGFGAVSTPRLQFQDGVQSRHATADVAATTLPSTQLPPHSNRLGAFAAARQDMSLVGSRTIETLIKRRDELFNKIEAVKQRVKKLREKAEVRGCACMQCVCLNGWMDGLAVSVGRCMCRASHVHHHPCDVRGVFFFFFCRPGLAARDCHNTTGH